jgi:alpha-galactosidase
VPLGSCFGQVDYCRIGGDIHLRWEHQLLVFLRHRERVSSIASLRSTLGRWQLQGRAFVNDPDVFILRSEQQGLSPAQQHTILTINVLLGGVLFTSDDPASYAPEQVAELEAALEWRGSTVREVRELHPDVYNIDFEHQGAGFRAWCNLSKRRVPVEQMLTLLPFETMILRR